MNDKKIIRINASALKQSACFLHFYRTVIQGYKEPIQNNDVEFGSAVHLFIKVMYQTNGAFDKAIAAARNYFDNTKMIVKPKKKYLDVFHLIKVCTQLWMYIQDKDDMDVLSYDENPCSMCGGVGHFDEADKHVDCTGCKRTGVWSNKPAVELTFSNKYFENDKYIVLLEGTIDRLGKIRQGGIYCVRDWKTTSSWDTDDYLSAYALNVQLLFYIFNLILHAKLNPDSFIAQITKLPVGAAIDGIFLCGKDKVEFARSEFFIPKQDKLDIFAKLLDRTVQRLINYLDAGVEPEPEGLINGSCNNAYGAGGMGKCKFFLVESAFDERDRMHLLKNAFIQQEYLPLRRQDD